MLQSLIPVLPWMHVVCQMVSHLATKQDVTCAHLVSYVLLITLQYGKCCQVIKINCIFPWPGAMPLIHTYTFHSMSIICDLILGNRPSCHIWYFEKYRFKYSSHCSSLVLDRSHAKYTA